MNSFFQLTNLKAVQAFQILRQGSVLLIWILLTRSSLSTEEIGYYEMVSFVCFTLTFFWLNGLMQGILPLYPKYSEKERRDQLYSIYLMLTGVAVVVYFSFFFFEGPLTKLFTRFDKVPYLLLYLAYYFINLPSNLLEYYYLLEKKPKHILTLGMLAYGGEFLCIVVPIFLGYTLATSFSLLIGLAIVKHLWTVGVIFGSGKPAINVDLLRSFLKFTGPLILISLMGTASIYADGYIVNWFFQDASTFAIFRLGARELPLVSALSYGFTRAMMPEIASNEVAVLSQIKSKSRKLMHLLFPIALALLLTSHWWFTLVFTEAFTDSILIFNTYLLLVSTRLIFPATILIGKQLTKVPFWATFTEALINIVMSIVFLKQFGLVGIAYATVLAFLIEKFILVTYLWLKEGIPFGRYTPVWTWAGYSVLLFLGYFYVM